MKCLAEDSDELKDYEKEILLAKIAEAGAGDDDYDDDYDEGINKLKGDI